MFNFEKKPHDVALDSAISDIFEEMNGLNSDSQAYSASADQLIKLAKLKKEINPSWRPSPDALVGAASSILGILCILHYEKIGNIVTSKALPFVGRMLK